MAPTVGTVAVPGAPMGLVEAFAILQPLGDDLALNAKIEEGSTLLLRALQQRGHPPPCRPSNVDDARQIVLIRVMNTGPRQQPDGTLLPNAPHTDDAVMAYLVRGVKRACIDWIRRTGPPSDPEELERVPAPEKSDDPEVAAYEAAEVRVFGEYRRRLTPALQQALDELRELGRTRQPVDAVIDPSGSLGPEELKKRRQARYTNYRRTIETLHDFIEEDRTLDDAGRDVHHQVVDHLRIRPRRKRRIR